MYASQNKVIIACVNDIVGVLKSTKINIIPRSIIH